MNIKQLSVVTLLTVNIACLFFIYQSSSSADVDEHTQIPDMVGIWSGENVTVSDLKGYQVWGEKVVEIIEQKDRRFRGTFTYPDGTKNFFGVIYPDNISFTWVASNSKGYNHGRILDDNTIGACYVESWEQATAGCATLTRKH